MLHLTNEQKALFALIKGETISNVSLIDWNEVMHEAQKQAIFLMLKQPIGLPDSISLRWNAIPSNIQSNKTRFLT